MGNMAGETTPLITTVRVGSVPQRYPHSTLRRFCTIALASSLIALFGTFLFTVVFGAQEPPHQGHWPGHGRRGFAFAKLKDILLDTASGEKASQWSQYYTSGPHLAGQNLSQVKRPRGPAPLPTPAA